MTLNWFVFFVVFLSVIECQKNDLETDTLYFTFNKISELPVEVEESSGIILYDSLVWTFNDSGGDNIIFGLEINNWTIKKKITLSNTTNIDWEEITQNNEYIFVGDFGNNDGTRKDLRIYYFKKSLIDDKPEQGINADTINFYFEDQFEFVSAPLATDFDCEAMVATDDSLYLFTKCWVSQHSTVYSIPSVKGSYAAEKLSVIDTKGLVTGADLKNNKLILCGYTFEPFILIFDNFKNFLQPKRIGLKIFSGMQTEGITVLNENELYLTNEKSSFPQSIYILKVEK